MSENVRQNKKPAPLYRQPEPPDCQNHRNYPANPLILKILIQTIKWRKMGENDRKNKKIPNPQTAKPIPPIPQSRKSRTNPQTAGNGGKWPEKQKNPQPPYEVNPQ